MIAVDTNVLVYRLDAADPVKQTRAHALINELASGTKPTVLLWQVCGEFVQQLRRRQATLGLDEPTLRRFVENLVAVFPIEMPSSTVLMRAIELTTAHSLSHWDSMLVAACIEAGVETLYTEDMGAPRMIESVALINPFAATP